MNPVVGSTLAFLVFALGMSLVTEHKKGEEATRAALPAQERASTPAPGGSCGSPKLMKVGPEGMTPDTECKINNKGVLVCTTTWELPAEAKMRILNDGL